MGEIDVVFGTKPCSSYRTLFIFYNVKSGKMKNEFAQEERKEKNTPWRNGKRWEEGLVAQASMLHSHVVTRQEKERG